MSDLVTFISSVFGATGAALAGIWLVEAADKVKNRRK